MEAVNGDTDKHCEVKVAFKSEDNETECCVLTVTDHVAEMQVTLSALSLSGLGVHKFQANDEYGNICPCFQLILT